MTHSPAETSREDRIVLISQDATDNRASIRGDRTSSTTRFDAGSMSWPVVERGSFLSGMVEAGRPGVRAVVARLTEPPRRVASAVSGLREVVGPDVRIVLCCPPETEPLARRLLHAGADEYVIDPPWPGEIERAVNPSERAPWPTDEATTGTDETAFVGVSPAFLGELGDTLCHLDAPLTDVLGRLALLARDALDVESAEVHAFGATGRTDPPVDAPHVVDELMLNGEGLGRLVLGPPCDAARTRTKSGMTEALTKLLAAALASHRREAQCRQQAMTDPVSGLGNRRYLAEALPKLIDRASREDSRVTALLFDIDNFKEYNDTYGHQAGDEIIREVGQLMRRCSRSHDIVVRYGGDEFVAVFWDADEPRQAGSKHLTDPLAVVDRFRDALLNHQFTSLGPNTRGRLTISGGLATFPRTADSAEALLARADEALLAAKEQGKNRVLPFGGGWLRGPSQGSGQTAADVGITDGRIAKKTI